MRLRKKIVLQAKERKIMEDECEILGVIYLLPL